ncbi:MAG: tyrosine-type recombinase/integrase [Halobacteriales archaeon]
MIPLDEITVVSGPSEQMLNQRQVVDYRTERENCLNWLLTLGKNPERAEGYAFQTVKARANRMDMFYRWVWKQEESYVANIKHHHAEEYLRHLASKDTSNADKANHLKAVKMLFKWRHHEHGLDHWSPSMSFYRDDSASQPRDFLTQEERSKIREAALQYGSIPAYNDLTPEQRDRWKTYLAQRFGKTKNEIEPSDWERANGWKIPSLVSVSLDCGLRPIEVERARTHWCDIENRVLRIPEDESSKNRENWVVSIHQRTAQMLERWLDERETYDRYNEMDHLWLTRKDNPYSSRSLSYLLERLCEIADISTDNRQLSWYAIRHSVGTYMTREEGLAAAQAQLRHKSEQTTMKYDQVPVEDRRDALDRMG